MSPDTKFLPGRLPWVFYVTGGWFGMVVDYHIRGLLDMANTLTFVAYPSFLERIRAKLAGPPRTTSKAWGHGAGSKLKPSVVSPVSSLATRIFDRLELRQKRHDAIPEPDLIVVAELFKKITDLNSFACPKAYYAVDPQIDIDRYFNFASLEDYDFIFVAQKDYIQQFKDRGNRSVYWLPWACEPRILYGPSIPKVYDVCVVGTMYHDHPRRRYADLLRLHYNTYVGAAYLHDMSSIHRMSKIVFNKTFKGDLNPRVFEAMCAGSFLLTDRIGNGFLDLFKEEVHLGCYGDEEELTRKVTYYLKHEEEREKIASLGQKEVLSKHTYTHRMLEVLKKCIGYDGTQAVRWRLFNAASCWSDTNYLQNPEVG